MDIHIFTMKNEQIAVLENHLLKKHFRRSNGVYLRS